MQELKIGDKLYRHVALTGIWEYEVIERRQNTEGMQYVVRSLACTHGWKCELLIAEADNGDLEYVRMVNNHDDDDQSYWHKPGMRFCLTKEQAKLDAYEKHLKDAKARVERAKEQVKAAEKQEEELKNLIKIVKDGM